jgi:TraM recognition site of TraD and TraG
MGAFIVSKLHQVVMGRQELGESERQNFYLYIDEFQNFITPSMAAILSGARKYHLGLVLSHQDLEQLSKRDSEVASSVISNPSTRVCFRLGDFDAKRLRDGFSSFGSEDLQNLGVGDAICRIERAEHDFNLKTLPLPEVDSDVGRNRQETVTVLSRQKYATGREEVEAEFLKDETAPERQPESEEATREDKTGAPPARETILQKPESKTREKPKETPKVTPRPTPPPPGRGGQQHTYLQNLIKRMGEGKGYRATIEKEILGGIGKVDVALEKDMNSIACEISVSTNVEHELENIQKCIAGGFEHVILISGDAKILNRAKTLAETALSDEDRKRISYLTPEEFLTFLEEKKAEGAGKDQTVRGYKVKGKYRSLGEEERRARKKVVAQTVLHALRKMKQK